MRENMHYEPKSLKYTKLIDIVRLTFCEEY